jgi:TrmH family RNA methyltransferase
LGGSRSVEGNAVSGLSARNPAVQHLRRLARRRDARHEADAFVIDGPVLLAEALDAGIELEAVYVERRAAASAEADDGLDGVVARVRAEGVSVLDLAPGVLAKAVDAVTPQGIAAIARRHPSPLAEVAAVASGLIVVLAGVSDPGNAGTLLRSAEASGATAIIATDGSVDLFAPKTVRASAGSLFRLPVVVGAGTDDVIDELHRRGHRCVGTVARGGVPYDESNLAAGVAIILGNEAHGLPDDLVDRLDTVVTIPMEGRAESLNVAMAGTILCFESARQRRAAAR